jgi:hypothetical protein
MGVLEAVLAVFGLVVLLRAYVVRRLARSAEIDRELEPEPDLAAPYREGLYAAMRMQVVAQDLERQMYAEAVRRVDEPTR